MGVQDNLELVRRGYAAFSAGDGGTLLELFAPDIVHSVPGSNSQIAGAHKGADDGLGLYAKLGELSNGTVKVELEQVLSDGADRVISIHSATAERNGETLTSREALLFTIADGKVVEIQDFFDDLDRVDAFWS